MKPDDNTARIVVTPHAEAPTERLIPPEGAAGDEATGPTVVIAPAAGCEDDAEDAGSLGIYEQYAVLGKIGDGGMGVVYLARDRRLGRFVAIKRLKSATSDNGGLRRRFLQEAKAAAALTHPHIAHVYGLGDDADGPYIVMEYVAGDLPGDPGMPGSPPPPETLERYVGKRGPLSVTVAVDLLLKISRAVGYAHSCHVIHRDLKPSNVLMDKAGEPKIVDFGLARVTRTEESQLTVPGEKLLSLGYGAPEQESDASVSDERADVYGLGALLYFVLTGQNPRYFREQDIPESIRAVLCRAMAHDREKRWPSVTAWSDELAALQSGTRVETPTIKTTWRCKWCESLNPLTTRFCAECGWDGGEECLECGAATHIGMPFCRACGANLREYEQLAVTLERARQRFEARQFEDAMAQTTRALGFEPGGPRGRRLQEVLQELRTSAETKIVRRDQLRELIEIELRAENYERAERFIQEFRDLSGDPKVFADRLSEIPMLIVRRDLARVRSAFRDRRWSQGFRLLRSLPVVGGDTAAERADLLRQYRRHRRGQRIRRYAGLVASLAAACVLAFPPAVRLAGDPPPRLLTPFLAPLATLYRHPASAPLLTRYAAFWAVPVSTLDALRSVPGPSEVVADTEDPSPEPPPDAEALERLRVLEAAYDGTMEEILSEYHRNMAAWPPDYRRALKAQRDRHQVAGDFIGWHAFSAEINRFEAEGGILSPEPEDPEDLVKMKLEFALLLDRHEMTRVRRIVSATKRQLNDLAALLRELTRAGQFHAAEKVNQAISRLRADPRFRDAEQQLAQFDVLYPDGELPALVPVGDLRTGELSELRSRYEEDRRVIDQEHESRMETWPQQYAEDLEILMEERQLEGDFNGWEAAFGELERFQIEGTLLPPTNPPADPAVEQLHQHYAAMRDDLRLLRARELHRTAEAYVARLDELVSQHTRSRNIEAAAAVNAEVRRVRASADWSEARQLLGKEPAAGNGENGDR